MQPANQERALGFSSPFLRQKQKQLLPLLLTSDPPQSAGLLSISQWISPRFALTPRSWSSQVLEKVCCFPSLGGFLILPLPTFLKNHFLFLYCHQVWANLTPCSLGLVVPQSSVKCCLSSCASFVFFICVSSHNL